MNKSLVVTLATVLLVDSAAFAQQNYGAPAPTAAARVAAGFERQIVDLQRRVAALEGQQQASAGAAQRIGGPVNPGPANQSVNTTGILLNEVAVLNKEVAALQQQVAVLNTHTHTYSQAPMPSVVSISDFGDMVNRKGSYSSSSSIEGQSVQTYLNGICVPVYRTTSNCSISTSVSPHSSDQQTSPPVTSGKP